MRAGYQHDVVIMVKLTCYTGAKQPASTPCIERPRLEISRIAPHEISKRTLMRYLPPAVNLPDLVDSLDIRGEAPMNAKDFTFNECANAEIIEHIE